MSFVGHPQGHTIIYTHFNFLIMASRYRSSCLMLCGVQCRQPHIFVRNEYQEMSKKIKFMKLYHHAQSYAQSVGMYLKIEYFKGAFYMQSYNIFG